MADVIQMAFQISADLKGVQTNLKSLEGDFQQSFGKIQGFAAGLGRDLIRLLSVGSVVAFGKSIVNLGGELTDLNQQTGTSVEFLSGFKSTLEEGGSSMATFAKGVFNLQKNLGNVDDDSDKAALAIKRLGLNLADLLNSNTDDFIKKVSDALGKIQNPIERATIRFNLLGKSAQELGPAFDSLAGKFDDFKNKGLSAKDVAALDSFGDSLTRLGNVFQIVTAGPLAGFAEKLELLLKLIGLFPKAAIENLEALKATVKSLNASVANSTGIEPGKLALMTTAELDQLGAARDTAIAAKVAIDKYVQARKALESLDKSIPFTPPADPSSGRSSFVGMKKPDTSAQKKAADAAKKAAEELRKFWEDVAKASADAIEQTEKKWDAAGTDMREVLKVLRTEGLAPAEQAAAEVNARFGEMTNKLIEAFKVTGQSEKLQPFLDRLDDLKVKALEVVDPLKQLQEQWEEMQAARTENMFSQDSSEWLDFPEGQAKEMSRIAEEAQSGFGMKDAEALIRGGAQGISDSLRSVAFGTQTLSEAGSNMGMAGVAAIQNIILELAILNPLIEGLKASFAGKTGGGSNGVFGAVGGFIGGLFGGTFADGGIVPGAIGAPKLAMVHGGETIFPTHKGGMGMGGTVNNYAIDARGAQRGVSDEIRRALEMTHRQAVTDSIAAVANERRRSTAYKRIFDR